MEIEADMKMCNHILWMCEVCDHEAGHRTETDAIRGVVLKYGLNIGWAYNENDGAFGIKK